MTYRDNNVSNKSNLKSPSHASHFPCLFLGGNRKFVHRQSWSKMWSKLFGWDHPAKLADREASLAEFKITLTGSLSRSSESTQVETPFHNLPGLLRNSGLQPQRPEPQATAHVNLAVRQHHPCGHAKASSGVRPASRARHFRFGTVKLHRDPCQSSSS